MEWSWWVTSNNACEPGEQLMVLANGDDESDLVGWSLLLLAATVRSAHMPLGISDRNTSQCANNQPITGPVNHNSDASINFTPGFFLRKMLGTRYGPVGTRFRWF